MKRKALAVFMTTAVVISSMAGCGVSTGSSNSKEEETTGSAVRVSLCSFPKAFFRCSSE